MLLGTYTRNASYNAYRFEYDLIMLDDDIKGCNATPCMERPDRPRTDQMALNVAYVTA